LDLCLWQANMEDHSRIFSQIFSPYRVSDVIFVGLLLCPVLETLSSKCLELGFIYSQFMDLSSLPHSGVIGVCSSQGVSPSSYS
jgi:hypothetical protein